MVTLKMSADKNKTLSQRLTVIRYGEIKWLLLMFLLLLFLIYGPVSIFTKRLQLILIIFTGLGTIFYSFALKKTCCRKTQFTFYKLSWPTTFFIVYLFLSMLIGILYGNSTGFIIGDIFPFVEFIVFYIVTWLVVKERSEIYSIFYVIFFAFLTKAMTLYYLLFSGALVKMQLAFSEVSSQIDIGGSVLGRPMEPNISLCMASLLLATALTRSITKKLFLYFTIMLFLLLTVLCFTRSIWIGSIITILFSLLMQFIYSDKRKVIKTIYLLVAGIIFFATAGFIFELNGMPLNELIFKRIFYSIEQLDSKLGNLRIYEIKDALREFSENFIFGKGMGGTLLTFVRSGGGVIIMKKSFVHNYLAGFLMKTGTIGVFLLLAVLYSMIKNTLILLKNHRTPTMFLTGTSFLSSLLGLLIFVNFQPILVAYHTPALLGILFSLLFVEKKLEMEEHGNL